MVNRPLKYESVQCADMPDPLELLQSSIPHFLQRIQQVRAELSAEQARKQDVVGASVSDARRQVATALGGLISEYLVGRRRPGQRLARGAVDEGRRARKGQARAAARNSAISIVDEFATAIERGLEDPVDWRILRGVRSRLASARALQRAESILIRVETMVQEVRRYSPPNDDYTMVRKLDLRFRAFIRLQLASTGVDWWIVRIPPPVRRKAERTRGKHGSSGANAVQFLTFGDYGRVILTDENWSEVFNRVLGDRAEFETKLKRLTDLRNSVAHSRPLSTSNRLELRALATRILAPMAG